jgi:creatinine amidohydrolase/Fe(II)-dependent formamide hydrolase-like protein
LGWGKKLSRMGFKYWVLIDNHGGYSHQLVIASAYKKLLKRERFYLVAPFIFIIRDMTEDCKETGLPEGRVGGLDDPHAGTNETSLMLAVNKRLVSKNYVSLGKYFPDRKTLFGRIVRTILREESMAISLDWINDPASPFYIGDPSIADRESGEVMIEFHVKRCVEVFNDAVRGEYRLPRLFNRMTSLILRAYPEW